MTTATETKTEAPVRQPKDPRESFSIARTPIYLAVAFIALIWTIPTLGLLVNSFREPRTIRGSCAPAGGCAAGTSTSCPSSGTCSWVT